MGLGSLCRLHYLPAATEALGSELVSSTNQPICTKCQILVDTV